MDLGNYNKPINEVIHILLCLISNKEVSEKPLNFIVCFTRGNMCSIPATSLRLSTLSYNPSAASASRVILFYLLYKLFTPLYLLLEPYDLLIDPADKKRLNRKHLSVVRANNQQASLIKRHNSADFEAYF